MSDGSYAGAYLPDGVAWTDSAAVPDDRVARWVRETPWSVFTGPVWRYGRA